MSAKSKTVFRGFRYQDCDDFAAYLNHMARQGWHFREWKAGLIFEQGPPEESRYAVEIFTDGTEYDTRPEPKTREFAEYCEAAGWQLVDAKKKFVIFKAIRENPLPIMTGEERLQNIAKEEQKNVWYHLIISALWSGMKAADFSSLSFANNIFSNTSLLITALWFLFLITSIFRAAHFYIWKARMRARISRGAHVHFGNSGKNGLGTYPIYNRISTLGCFLYLLGCWYFGQFRMVLFFFGYLAVLLIMGYLIARFRPESNTNALIQTVVPMVLFIGLMVVSLFLVYDSDAKLRDRQEIPLLAEDLHLDYGQMKNSTGYITNSIFGTHTAYSITYQELHTIFYVAYDTEEEWILDRIWQIETKGAANEVRTDCAEIWGADTGFRNGNDKYFLRYPDGILIFTVYKPFEPTAEQIGIILEKLGLR